MAPSLICGVSETDSSRYNYVWATQFDRLLAAGTPYPRWLPQSFGGLGSPAFVFYPPLAYLAVAAVNLVTAGALGAPWLMAVAATAMLALSGVTMLLWLRAHATPPAALALAICSMAAPYHLADHYWRGATAEFAAFAMVPLVLAGIDAAVQGWRGSRRLAVGYALLIATHLPTAVLGSLTILPCYALYRSLRPGLTGAGQMAPAQAMLRCGLGAGLGVGLACVYLLPALSLVDATSSAQLWREAYQPVRWLVIHPGSWPTPLLMRMLSSFALATAVLCLGCLLLTLRPGRPAGPEARWDGRSDVRFWAACGLGCVFLMAVGPAAVWRLPVLAKVQFPWRILVLAELSGLTALACLADRLTRRQALGLAVCVLLPLLPGLAILSADSTARLAAAPAYWRAFIPHARQFMPDASEYLPAGFPPARIGDAAAPELVDLPSPDAVSCSPAAALCRIGAADAEGGARLRLDVAASTVVHVPRFYFPGWHAVGADGRSFAVSADPPWQTLRFAVPPGRYDVRVGRGWVPAEWLGLAMSMAVLAGLAGWRAREAAVARRGRR